MIISMFNTLTVIFKDYFTPYLKEHNTGLLLIWKLKFFNLGFTEERDTEQLWTAALKYNVSYVFLPVLFLASHGFYVAEMETSLISPISYRACKMREKY